MLERCLPGSYLLLVDYTGRLFREGNAFKQFHWSINEPFNLPQNPALSVHSFARLTPEPLPTPAQLRRAGRPFGTFHLTIKLAQGAPGMRFFRVVSRGNLLLANLTFTGGIARGGNGGSAIILGNGGGGGGGAGLGGAIFNDEGSVTIYNCTFTSNTAQGGDAGAAGSTVSPSSFSAAGGGGGMLTNGRNTDKFTAGRGGDPNGGDGGASAFYTASSGSPGGFGGGGGGGGAQQNLISLKPDGGNGGPGGFGGGGGGGGVVYSGVFTHPQAKTNGGPGGFGGGGGAGYHGAPGGFGGGDGIGSSGLATRGAGGGAGMGGAIFNRGGIVNIANSTFSGNQAIGGHSNFRSGFGYGGAIFSLNGKVMTITNTTIVGNTASQPKPDSSDTRSKGNQGSGGGIFSLADGGPARLDIFNTVVANNIADQTNPKDVVAMAIRNGVSSVRATNDLIRSSSGFTGTHILLVEPQLGPLKNNGGPTATMLPNSGSPVVGGGDPSFAKDLKTDQRGFTPRVSNGKIDLGAVQANATAPTQTDPAKFRRPKTASGCHSSSG
jgi:hypothetical protein